MGRTQALTCMAVLFFILVAQHAVQADTDCHRQCPGLCHAKGKSMFQCYLYCIKHCSSGKSNGVNLTKEEDEQLKSDNEAMLSDIEEQLIHSPHHKLERDYESKLKHPLSNQQEVQGDKKLQGRKEKQGDKEVEQSK